MASRVKAAAAGTDISGIKALIKILPREEMMDSAQTPVRSSSQIISYGFSLERAFLACNS